MACLGLEQASSSLIEARLRSVAEVSNGWEVEEAAGPRQAVEVVATRLSLVWKDEIRHGVQRRAVSRLVCRLEAVTRSVFH